jgi:hypothetical protein
MLIIDAHLDLSWNALGWNRDLTLHVANILSSEAGMPGKGRGHGVVSFPEMRRGQVGISLATVLARSNPSGRSSIDFRTQEIACATAKDSSHTTASWSGGISAGCFGIGLLSSSRSPSGKMLRWTRLSDSS